MTYSKYFINAVMKAKEELDEKELRKQRYIQAKEDLKERCDASKEEDYCLKLAIEAIDELLEKVY